MSSTTMRLRPGLPIMKARHLVNWHQAGCAYGVDFNQLRVGPQLTGPT